LTSTIERAGASPRLEGNEFAGWIQAWIGEWEAFGGSPMIVDHLLDVEIPLHNLVSNAPVLDVSVGVAPPADWLEETLLKLRVDNLLVAREATFVDPFQEIICRDQRPVVEILRRSKRKVAVGGRWYLARYHDEGFEPDDRLFQKFPMGPRCFVLHYIGVPEEPGVSTLLATGKLLLDKIEGEMKRAGMWSENPPPMPPLKSYLDAPSFELWLQCVFLGRAREAVSLDEFPEDSQVSRMAQQQDMDESRLMEYLRALDLVVLERNQPGLKLTGMQAVSEGGRLLTKGKWREPAWYSVDATPYDTDYFPKALASPAWGLGMEVQGEDPWEFVLDGARIGVRMNYRGSCSIAAETMAVRDKIFDGLVRSSC